jgi:hypothetical protein
MFKVQAEVKVPPQAEKAPVFKRHWLSSLVMY